jgi:hypothetical protein
MMVQADQIVAQRIEHVQVAMDLARRVTRVQS